MQLFELRSARNFSSRVRPLAWLLLLCAIGPLLSACASPWVDPKHPGVISGTLMVFWVGDDKFVYYPAPSAPLTFKLPPFLRDKVKHDDIVPGAIYTDGGSIPRALRSLVGFSPWGYGPAYIVHDWLFVAHHCIVTKQEAKLADYGDEVAKVRNVDFKASADMLAAVIQALIEQDKVPRHGNAPEAIYSGVDSFVARNLWDTKDPDSCEKVSDADLDKIRKALQQRSTLSLSTAQRIAPQPGNQPVLVYQQQF